MADYGSHPLKPLIGIWMEKFRLAYRDKKKKFQDSADEAMQYYNGPYTFMYEEGRQKKNMIGDLNADFPLPVFKMQLNKAAELVQIFGPAMYHKNPTRQVNPVKPPMLPIEVFGDPNDPNPAGPPPPPQPMGMPPPPQPTIGDMVQQQFMQVKQQIDQLRAIDKARATLLEYYQNYTPSALDLKSHSRRSIDEALIKGMGLLITEVYQPVGAPMKMVGSFHRSVNDLLLDPDPDRYDDIKWGCLRCVEPYWELARQYGQDPEEMKKYATLESLDQQSVVNTDVAGDYRRKQGQTNDLIVYYKLWSKMGMGSRSKGAAKHLEELDRYGDFIFMAMSENCAYPFNVPPEVAQAMASDDPMQQMMADEMAKQALQWPTPFWADDTWPWTPIQFHEVPNQYWPASHLGFGLGELKFLNWAYTFLMQKIKIASRDFIAIAKSSGEEIKKQIQMGQDYTFLEIENIHGSIDKMVSFLQHPGFHPEIWKIIEGVTHQFEQRTGLTELVYGMSARQMRSAEEASLKSDQIAVRPDDMANKVEDAMSLVAEKEAFAARWHLTAEDVAPIMGPQGAQWWQQFVMTSNPAEIIHQLEYRIEAGSAKKPNKARDAANMSQAMQNLSQLYFQYASSSGDVGPFNTLVGAWAKSIDMDATGLLLKPPPPPPPMPPPGPPQASAPPAANGHAPQPMPAR